MVEVGWQKVERAPEMIARSPAPPALHYKASSSFPCLSNLDDSRFSLIPTGMYRIGKTVMNCGTIPSGIAQVCNRFYYRIPTAVCINPTSSTISILAKLN